jgi:hypothetical protein
MPWVTQIGPLHFATIAGSSRTKNLRQAVNFRKRASWKSYAKPATHPFRYEYSSACQLLWHSSAGRVYPGAWLIRVHTCIRFIQRIPALSVRIKLKDFAIRHGAGRPGLYGWRFAVSFIRLIRVQEPEVKCLPIKRASGHFIQRSELFDVFNVCPRTIRCIRVARVFRLSHYSIH